MIMLFVVLNVTIAIILEGYNQAQVWWSAFGKDGKEEEEEEREFIQNRTRARRDF